jgi:hypothetical protein
MFHRLGGKLHSVYEVVTTDSGGTDDPLNNDPAGSKSLSKKGEVMSVIFYENKNEEQTDYMGEYDEDYPNIAIPDDDQISTNVVDDDRLLIDDILYEVDTPTKRRGFIVWNASAVDQYTDSEEVPS